MACCLVGIHSQYCPPLAPSYDENAGWDCHFEGMIPDESVGFDGNWGIVPLRNLPGCVSADEATGRVEGEMNGYCRDHAADFVPSVNQPCPIVRRPHKNLRWGADGPKPRCNPKLYKGDPDWIKPAEGFVWE